MYSVKYASLVLTYTFAGRHKANKKTFWLLKKLMKDVYIIYCSVALKNMY